MTVRPFVIRIAVMMALSVPRTSLAQMICTGTGDPCNSPGTCTPSGCKTAVYCDSDDDCLPTSGCVRGRCICSKDSDCGAIGKCYLSENGTGTCRRPDEPAGCADKCDSNLDCNDDAMCTFGYDDTRGLCCPRLPAEGEESFHCGIHAHGSLDGLEPFALMLVATIAAAIRSRLRSGATR